MSESYITHIRIEEDAAYPSSPPPASSVAENKKQRVIIVAVRKSGRVRMHKARENANGTFSIGKTWVLDDLTVIESYTNAVPRNAEEQQNKQRAGSVGFTVTIQKPYYWQAATAKEKEFFIFSLIKIFKKYTGGRLPELLGFSSQEVEQLGGLPSGPPGQTDSQSRAPPIPPVAAGRVSSQDGTQPREARTNGALQESRFNGQQNEASRERRHRPSQERPSQERVLHSAPSQERTLHSTASQDRSLRSTNSNDRMYVPGAFPSSESVNRQDQHPHFRRKRSESPGGAATLARGPDVKKREGSQPDSLNALGRAGNEHGRQPSNERLQPNGSLPPTFRAGSSQPQRSEPFEPPTRRNGSPDIHRREISQERPPPTAGKDGLSAEESRPTKPPTLSNRSYRSDRSAPAPEQSNVNGDARAGSVSGRVRDRGIEDSPSLSQSESSGRRSEDTRPTTASSQAPAAINNVFKDVAIDHERQRNDSSSQKASTSSITPTATPPPPETPTEPEAHRPGLGPMIKKKSTREIASTFRKAATAANAFKPRAGGANEQPKDENASGGDGITGVFQAPSLLRGVSQDDSQPSKTEPIDPPRPLTPLAQRNIPGVQITTSPVKSSTSAPAAALLDMTAKGLSPEKPAAAQEKPQEERRKRRRSDHSARYAKSLGIDPSLLEGRTFEIEDVLNDFGWGNNHNEKVTFEDLQTGIRKELAHVEAGSWLGAVENNDDRTAAVGEMMDRVMAECEELDCLLTLYNVELGVSIIFDQLLPHTNSNLDIERRRCIH